MPRPTTNPSENILQKAVAAHFSTRPTLRSVAAQTLTYTLKEKYALLPYQSSDLYLALPRDGGGRTLQPLLDVALQHIADGSFPDLSTRDNLDCYLSDATGTRLDTYDVHVVKAVVWELPLILFISFQDALADYWGQNSDAGGNRWQWLARLLQGMLRTAAIRQSGDDAEQLQILSTLASYPSREARANLAWPDNSIHAYTLEAHLVRDSTTLTLQSSDLLVVSGKRVFLCTLAGQVEHYASLDAFAQAWGERMGQQFIADKITWRQYEPDGDIFEVQAALALNQQLEDLAAIQLPAGTSVSKVEGLFESITNPATLFTHSPLTPVNTLSPIQAALPEWLRAASPADLFTYRQCVIEQASLRRLTRGEGYLSGLDDIRTYAASHLNHQLCLKRNFVLHGTHTCTDIAHSKYKANELELTFDVAVGTLQSGYIEKVTMSLVDLALKNLSGKPSGTVSLRHTGGQEIEAWLTQAYLDELVQRVNVGLNYPVYIQQQLLSDTAEAEKRKHLFCGQRPIDLKIQALEHKIKGQAGLTPRGLRYVMAVVGTHRTERWVDNDEIVIRALAFQRKPGAKADVAQNMFIIESRNGQSGPHLLYRPAYQDALLEFASRHSLLAAIAQPGAIQESVLTWLADDARDVYSNGGFKEPHYVRVSGIGSEFDPLPSVPKPPTLASTDDESNDQILQALNNNQLMEYLFVCEARQLLGQADRESTSNAESRWALILEGVQLGFNTLLMLVRGPLAAVGWFMQLALSLEHDLPALASQDPIARELAWVDLLLNLSMVLIHHGLPSPAAGRPLIEDSAAQQPLVALPLRQPYNQAISQRPIVERGIVGLPSEPPGGGKTLLDIDRSLASDSASARLLQKLLEVNVPWPEPAPEPIATGALKGLFKLDNLWYSSVAGLFFRVGITPGVDEVFIIAPEKPEHPGIKLRANGLGRWTLDRGLKLAGGGPKRLAALREENQRQIEQLQGRMQVLSVELTHAMPELKNWLTRINSNRETLIKQINTLKLVWRLLETASGAQKSALQARHEQEISNYSKIRTDYELVLERLERQHALLLPKRIELFKVGQDLERYAGARGHVQDRATTLKTLWDDQQRVHIHLQKWADTFLFSDLGEPMNDLVQRMLPELQSGRPWIYNEHMTRSIGLADVIQRMAARSREMETTLALLEQDSVAGRAIREELLAKIDFPQHFFSDNLEIHALIPLSWGVVKPSAIEPSPLEALYIQHLDDSGLSQALLSHTEVRSSTGYPLDAQRMLYDTLLDKYRSYAHAIEALKFINPQRVHPIAERLLNGLKHAHTLAETELEAVVRSQEALEVEASLATLRRPKAPTKRIFKTRNRKYLVGNLIPADGQHPHEHLTITNTFTGETVSSFNQFDSDSWVEAPQTRVALPEPAPQASSLVVLRTQGEILIQQRTEIERVITTQQQKLESPISLQDVNPADWNELLTEQAKKLTDLADEISREHRNQPLALDLIDNYRAHARDMQRMAKRVCSEAYKRQWPTLQSLEYLWRQKEIDINLTSQADPQRPTLSGDFFTEYAVYDKAQKPPQVLWYAHFHYATANAPPSRYTRAHLKLASQRKYTQKDLLKAHIQARLSNQQAPGAEPIEKILYVLITPPEDQLFLAIAPSTT